MFVMQTEQKKIRTLILKLIFCRLKYDIVNYMKTNFIL